KVDQGPNVPDKVEHPLYVKVRGRKGDGSPLVTSPTPTGYTPQQIKAYLGLQGTGAGRTIAIVDANDHPNIAADLTVFSAQFGLPLVCGPAGAAPPPACLTFTKATPQGTPPVDQGWALEIALDVEWAHAVAPGAKILLVEAKSASLGDLLSAISY